MSFNAIDGDSWQDNPPVGIWEDASHLGMTFVASPTQFLEPLLDPDPTFLRTQPSSPVYPPTCEAPRPESFAVAPSNPNAHAPVGFHGWPLQIDLQPVPYFTPSSIPEDSGPMPTVMPTAHRPSATLDAGPSLMPNDLQGYSFAVGSLPFHDAGYYPQYHSTHVQSRYNGPQVFVDPPNPFNSAEGTPYQQVQPAPTGAVRSSSSVPSDSAFQPMVSLYRPVPVPPIRRNSRGNRSVTSSPYPIRTSSLPVLSASPDETAIHICQWMGDDGTTCGVLITGAPGSVSEHLTTHGVKNMAYHHRLPCRWLGCRLRGDKDKMKRESIVRHVREKHLGYKRDP